MTFKRVLSGFLWLSLMAWPVLAADQPAPTPSGLEVPRFVSLRGDKTNARIGPSIHHPIKWTYHKRGLPVQITAETDEWRRIKDPEGGVAWVKREMLSSARTVMILGPDELILRKKPEAASGASAILAPGVIASLKRCADQWCKLEVDGREGWAEQRKLWGLQPEERTQAHAPS